MKRLLATSALVLVVWCLADAARAQRGRPYPPQIPGAQVRVYKTVGETRLQLWFFFPEGHRPGDSRAAVVFFFGGGWRTGSPMQFVQHARHFASRGMVAAVADYRVASRHQAKVNDCVEDAKSAVRYLRMHAKELGIDPRRIVTSGGSAGGHLAIATAVLPGLEAPGEDHTVSSQPNAVAAFNPAVVLAPVPGESFWSRRQFERVAQRVRGDTKAVSPYHHIRPGLPPMIIFHGTNDRVVPLRSVEIFAQAMQKAGNKCILKKYEGAGHGFFNYRRRGNGNPYFKQTLEEMDRFLVQLGFLPAP